MVVGLDMRNKTVFALASLVIVIYLLSLVTPTQAKKETLYTIITKYQVDYIENGDIYVKNDNHNFLVPMHVAFKFNIDVLPKDTILIYVDNNNKIINMEVLK